jgi:hypothetical protein
MCAHHWLRDSRTRFWYPFLIVLDRYEIPNRAGAILITFSYLNCFKISKDPLQILDQLPSGGFFLQELQAHGRGIQLANGYSIGN